MPPPIPPAPTRARTALHLLVEPVPGGDPAFDALVQMQAGATIVGTAGNDYISPNSPGGSPSTTSGNDQVRGLAGNDYIDGWLGNDKLDGGDGNDTLVSGEGNDTLNGGVGDDRLQLQVTVDPGHPDADISIAYGGAGNDSIEAFEGLYPGGRGASGTFDGGSGDDRLVIWARQRGDLESLVLGGDGKDSLEVTLVAGPGTVIVDGGTGDDILLVDCFDPFRSWNGNGSQTQVNGGSGDDNIAVRASNLLGSQVAIDAGDGNDTLNMSYVNDGGVRIALGAGNDAAYLYFTNGIAVSSGNGADTVSVGNSVGLNLDTGKGDDQIVLDACQATVSTGAGRDTLLVGDSLGRDALRTSTVLDFTAGDGGDRLDLNGVNALLGLPAGSDPFSSGRARIEQGAAGALLTLNLGDQTHEDWVTLLVMKKVAVSDLTVDNFVQVITPPTPDTGSAQTTAGLALDDLLTSAGHREIDLRALDTGRTQSDSPAAPVSHAAPEAAADATGWLGWADAGRVGPLLPQAFSAID